MTDRERIEKLNADAVIKGLKEVRLLNSRVNRNADVITKREEEIAKLQSEVYERIVELHKVTEQQEKDSWKLSEFEMFIEDLENDSTVRAELEGVELEEHDEFISIARAELLMYNRDGISAINSGY